MVKLPITRVAAVLFAFSLIELTLMPQTSPAPAVIAVHVVVLATFAALPRAPIAVLALILLELMLVKELRINEWVSVSLALLTPFAGFAAAALAPVRRLPVVVLLLAVHMTWRATLPSAEVVLIVVNCGLIAAAVATGAMVRERHRRLVRLVAERDALVAALDAGPSDAGTAEQLRMWSLIEQRVEPVIAALPELVERAAHAPEPEAAARLAAVRAQAADALAEMQETVRSLDGPPPLVPAAVDDTRLRRVHAGAADRRAVRLRSASPLVVACALLAVAGLVELAVVDGATPWPLLLAAIPLLVPRAPLVASLVFAGVAIVCFASGAIALLVTTPDFAASLMLVVLGAHWSRRGALGGMIVGGAMLAAFWLDAAGDWEAVSYFSAALLYLGHWIAGALLHDLASEQRAVGMTLTEVASALDALRARAVRRERVRLARELHDMVGHALTAVAIQAGVGEARLKRGLQPTYAPLADAARQGTVELRRLAQVLGHEADIAAELRRVTDTARATGQRVELDLEPPERELAPAVRHTVVCVVAEALTNAAKHAAGATVRVRVKARADRLELAVVDDGGGHHELPSGGHGIDSMAARVHACGGTFASGPRPGGGWTVQAALPLSV
ncbi:hypothetical protein DVA67_001430 [Solirubrobacter sp. CPCC 204708]|uniref:histidine kinase n=1 Tax=Solirubrobacter deserti TaxID=2282478 RepID=A0ABT4RDN3_9ACTN|nr:histidine kinase [Solirubrobacter deserti]MBE2314618.1 hypothetical protein [Solirubrobacter deserti]MDA0136625.1 histidine kinase [Solirubrobacter deserti]